MRRGGFGQGACTCRLKDEHSSSRAGEACERPLRQKGVFDARCGVLQVGRKGQEAVWVGLWVGA